MNKTCKGMCYEIDLQFEVTAKPFTNTGIFCCSTKPLVQRHHQKPTVDYALFLLMEKGRQSVINCRFLKEDNISNQEEDFTEKYALNLTYG